VEKEEHDKEAHTKVECPHCNIQMEKRQLESHESGCTFKPRPCRYCE
jgi:hypothetical protein